MTQTAAATLPAAVKTSAALRWLKSKAGQEWGLTIDDMSILLGGIPRRTLQLHFQKAEAREPVNVSRDAYDRLSILLGIYSALEIFGPTGAEQSFFSRPYSAAPLNGKSIKDELLADGSLVGLNNMRRWINAKRG